MSGLPSGLPRQCLCVLALFLVLAACRRMGKQTWFEKLAGIPAAVTVASRRCAHCQVVSLMLTARPPVNATSNPSSGHSQKTAPRSGPLCVRLLKTSQYTVLRRRSSLSEIARQSAGDAGVLVIRECTTWTLLMQGPRRCAQVLCIAVLHSVLKHVSRGTCGTAAGRLSG